MNPEEDENQRRHNRASAGGGYSVRLGASLEQPTRRRNASYSHTYGPPQYYFDDHDNEENENLVGEALSAAILKVIDTLDDFDKMCLETYLYDARGTGFHGMRAGRNHGIRETTRHLPDKPDGKRYDKNTVKRALDRAFTAVEREILALPDWQRTIIGRSLQPGALMEAKEVGPVDLPSGLPGTL
jgi:hypothetical protein